MKDSFVMDAKLRISKALATIAMTAKILTSATPVSILKSIFIT